MDEERALSPAERQQRIEAAQASSRRSGLVIGGLVVAAASWTLGPAVYWDLRAAKLRSSGTVASARVVELRDTHSVFNDDPVVEITLELLREGQPPGPRGSLKDALSPVVLPRYQPGAVVKVWFDPNDPAQMAIEPE